MYTPFKRTISLAIDLWNRLRPRGSAGLRAVPLTALGLLLALAVGGGATEIYHIIASPAPSTSPGRMSALASADAGALAQCERSLREARRQMREQPDDGPACLRVASLEMRRSDLLALLTEEMQSHTAAGTAPESRVNPQWRQHFLRGDPAGTLGRAARAAEAALRAPLDPPSRRRALLLLAAARAARGNYHGEVEALAEAARREPGEATLWLRLSEAYQRTHQFARAAEARERGLSLQGGEGAAPYYPGAASESRSDR
jgi:predicted Zn-dependent protease